MTLQDSSDITPGVVKTRTELTGPREQRASRTTAGKRWLTQKSRGARFDQAQGRGGGEAESDKDLVLGLR